MTRKLKKKFEEFKEKKGTLNFKDSITNQSQQEEADIYACIEKYGIQSLTRQTMAKQELYLDNTNRALTLDEALRKKEEIDEYFKNLPARARKAFGDNADVFYYKYNNGEFEDFRKYGILNDNQIRSFLDEKQTKNDISNESISSNTDKIDNTTVEGN